MEDTRSSNVSGQLMEKRETDWFRGIAAVMVLLSHYAEWWVWFTPMEGDGEIFRSALMKLGVYGVDIFFLFSGYAMVRSMRQERMYPEFVWKRIKNVYIPYFFVVGCIELLSGGFISPHDFWNFVSGKDYWYMQVLFIFYIGFIAIYIVMEGREPRCAIFCVFTYCFSIAMYNEGMRDFWFVSNVAFAMGVVVAEYEEPVKKLVDKAGIPMAAILMVGMKFVVQSGLNPNAGVGRGKEELLRMEIGATVIWTFLVLILAAKCRMKGKIFAFLGKNSLYIYLTHTFIFMWLANTLECNIVLRFLISAAVTIAVSALCNLLVANMGRKMFFRKNSNL